MLRKSAFFVQALCMVAVAWPSAHDADARFEGPVTFGTYAASTANSSTSIILFLDQDGSGRPGGEVVLPQWRVHAGRWI